MNMRPFFLLPLLLVLPNAQAGSAQAYTWIDESGTRHFSEDPPYDETITAEQIELLPAPSAGNISSDNDFYSVINQADRMEKKRLANEKLIAERLQAELEARRANAIAPLKPQTPNQKVTQESTRYPAYPPQTNTGPWLVPGNKPQSGKQIDPGQIPVFKPRTLPGK